MKILKFLQNEKVSFALIVIGIGIILIFVIPFVWNDFALDFHQKANSEKLAQYGDFVGGIVGSIWSLAGVILFYIALTEQRGDFKTNQEAVGLQVKALNQQIEEFKLQRTELESSRKIYEEQSKTLRTQQFESNFYSLLNVYLTIKNNLNNIDTEKDFFRSLYKRLDNKKEVAANIIDHHNYVVGNYVDLFNSNSGHLSHYFKSFYRIIKVIDSHISLEPLEKTFYSKILRSQLTDYEQLMLYYNSFTLYGEKARPFILKYNLLKHSPIFKKSEFAKFFELQNNSKILLFSEWLTRFLVKTVNAFYDLDFASDKIEDSCKYFDCIVGAYFSDKLEVKVYCQKDIKSNHINLSENQFEDFFYNFLYDRLIFSSYIDPANAVLKKSRTETETQKIFAVAIETSTQINLTQD